MKAEWSLDRIYTGFETEKFIADEKKLDTLLAEFTAFADNLGGDTAETVTKGIKYLLEITELESNLGEYASFRSSTNTSDAEAVAVSGRLAQKYSVLAGPSSKFVKYIGQIDNLDEVIAANDLLKEHEFYLKKTKEGEKYVKSPEVEEVISTYQISGSYAWGELQSFLTSTVPVEYNGGVTNLSDIRNKAYDTDPEVRKSAYEAEIKCYDRIKDAIAYSLNSLKLETINRCKIRGYESPLDETLKDSNMKRETLDAMMSAIEDYLPKFWEYLKAKAKLLGYENGLPWYDLFAPLEGNDRKFTIEESKDYLVKLFSTFDKEEADMIARAFDDEWIDFYPHAGKVGGAYCAPVYSLGESRILTNFDGALGDVVTLAHELGHAFHNHCLRENSIINTDISMQVAETASTFNEVVAMNAAIKEEKDPVARRALIESQLMDATQIICDIYSRYTFETAVFARRENEFMFADELCNIMLDAQKKAYGDGLDENCLHPFMWACKGHYYGSPSFYNFPYAFGGLFARGLYAKYLKEGESFVGLYKSLLKATGTTSVEGAALVADIDITKKEFWCSSLQILADEIDEFVSLC